MKNNCIIGLTDIFECPISQRLKNVLCYYGKINFVYQLADLSLDEIKEIKGIGSKLYAEAEKLRQMYLDQKNFEELIEAHNKKISELNSKIEVIQLALFDIHDLRQKVRQDILKLYEKNYSGLIDKFVEIDSIDGNEVRKLLGFAMRENEVYPIVNSVFDGPRIHRVFFTRPMSQITFIGFSDE